MYVELNAYILIYIFSVIGLAFAGLCVYKISEINVKENSYERDEGEMKDKNDEDIDDGSVKFSLDQIRRMKFTSDRIAEGANIFLLQEYLITLIFVLIFSLLIIFLCEKKIGYFYTTIAFIIGTQTSLLAGFVGMRVATATNIKTAYMSGKSIGEGFKVAYYGGCVLGFYLVSSSIIVLCTIQLIYKAIRFSGNDLVTQEDWQIVFEGLAGYGLGSSSIALFCRVGGGIYTKAADVAADLVSKLELGLEEDDPKNPACIADNVGDNVGDIAGMGSDLFGSMAESLTAALLIAATSQDLTSTGGYLYPVMIIACGIIVCIVITYVGFIAANDIETYEDLENSIKLQLLISCIVLIPTTMLINQYYLPDTFSIGEVGKIGYMQNINKQLMVICPLSGLISGLLIGISTEYFTSLNHKPVKDLAQACKEGAAINTILGLALGFVSNIIPTILIALSIFASFKIAGLFGISLAAIGMLGNLPICLAIDGYGPISDNAGGIASMSELDPKVREITDQLDAVGNTTAAIGKGFAIGSACLCAFALYGAFLTKASMAYVNFLTPLVMFGVLFGSMIPYIFSATSMKAVGTAAEEIVSIIRKDYNENKNEENHVPDSNACVEAATRHSLYLMIFPAMTVILPPFFIGFLLGVHCLAGYLVGVIISGIQLAISMSNSGGAWDNTKKLIKNRGLPIKGIERFYNMKKDLKHVIERSEGVVPEIEKLRQERLTKTTDFERKVIDESIEQFESYILSEEERERVNADLEEANRMIEKLEQLIQEKKGVPELIESYKPYATDINDLEKREKEKEEKILIRELHKEEIMFAKFPQDYLKEKKNFKRRTYRFAEKASITCDTIGDPLKDTSGPSVNILIKLSSIFAVIFAFFFKNTGWGDVLNQIVIK